MARSSCCRYNTGLSKESEVRLSYRGELRTVQIRSYSGGPAEEAVRSRDTDRACHVVRKVVINKRELVTCSFFKKIAS